MKSVDEWKALLRAKLRDALGAKDMPAVRVLRETMAAIDNAEAPPMHSSATTEGAFAGSVSGVGAAEVERLALSPEAVGAIVEREIRERREAGAQYVKLGRAEEARVLSSQADLLSML